MRPDRYLIVEVTTDLLKPGGGGWNGLAVYSSDDFAACESVIKRIAEQEADRWSDIHANYYLLDTETDLKPLADLVQLRDEWDEDMAEFL